MLKHACNTYERASVSARPRYVDLRARKTTQIQDSTTFPSAELSGSHEPVALNFASKLSELTLNVAAPSLRRFCSSGCSAAAAAAVRNVT
eukprot:5750362-Alexandrium_andersonii.AAC.1